MAKADFTLDAFHRGKFWLNQPVGKGHRAGMDAMLLGASVPEDFAGVLADLGAGAGAAGLAAMARCANGRAVLVEASAEMCSFARATLDLGENKGLKHRASVLQADVTLAGTARQAAGLEDNSFDYVIMNPPFNAASDRMTPDRLKAEAHVMGDDMWERWIRTAAAIAKPGAGLALIARPRSLAEILGALASRFGAVEIKPIHPRQGEAAIRIVARARHGSRAPITFCPPLLLHQDDQTAFSPETEAISNGGAELF